MEEGEVTKAPSEGKEESDGEISSTDDAPALVNTTHGRPIWLSGRLYMAALAPRLIRCLKFLGKPELSRLYLVLGQSARHLQQQHQPQNSTNERSSSNRRYLGLISVREPMARTMSHIHQICSKNQWIFKQMPERKKACEACDHDGASKQIFDQKLNFKVFRRLLRGL